ncbi:MAG: hypothetical protein P1V35_05940 [Planctomycetota bacterium]|nr:hypothetical protein [Planctomycetota bacterium]
MAADSPIQPSRLPLRAAKRSLRAKLFSTSAFVLGVLPPFLATRLLQGPSFLARRSRPGKIAARNLDLAFGEDWSAEQHRECLRGVFHHTARLISEVSLLSKASEKRRLSWLQQNVHVHDSIEHLHSALRQGKGVILATAHLGNWELIAPALVQLGMQGAVVGRFRERDPSAEWIVKMRTRSGVQTLPQDSNPKDLVRLLRNGQVLGLVCDLEVKRLDGEFLPFFGEPALTMTAPAALTRTSGAPIVPVRCVRTKENPERYTLQCERALRWDPSLPKPEARTQLLRKLNGVYEGWIREHPEQWAWYQPRWRTRPGQHESLPIRERNRRNMEGPSE